MYKFFLLFFIVFTFLKCNSSQNNMNTKQLSNPNLLKLSFADNKTVYLKGDTISISIIKTDIPNFDSCHVFIDNYLVHSIQHIDNIKLISDSLKMGTRKISLKYFSNNEIWNGNISFTLIPKDAPIQRKYKIINTYPHDIEAYTQGLEFDEGVYMYEGTGLRGKSTLRKVNFETGKVEQVVELEDTYFGEGISIVDNKIFQLTWQEKIGFVWDKESFNLISTFTYPTEGWGLCFDGTNLLMSDGSNNIYTMSVPYFKEIDRIEVFTNAGAVRYLNELEYIEGYIYANVYQSDIVVKIDPFNGEVIERIDFSGLLKKEDIKPQTDVLNGIAYDSINKRLFVTGKNWPKLFEVEIY
jgi:glutaminyl-peptide cyclotransferase